MPFKSMAQERYMFAKEPQIAKRWANEYGAPQNLPQHKEKKKSPSAWMDMKPAKKNEEGGY